MLPVILDFLFILFVHWVADFVLQTDEMAKNKSTDNYALNSHVATYTIVTTIAWWLYFQLNVEAFFAVFVISYLTHFVTDYFTSRLNSHLWKKGEVHYFFVSIGFDQLIHFTTLFLTLLYIK